MDVESHVYETGETVTKKSKTLSWSVKLTETFSDVSNA